MGENKIKHIIGLIHSVLWVVAFFESSGDWTYSILTFSIVYYAQDIVWSYVMRQHFVILHHVCVSTFWYILIQNEPIYIREDRKLLYYPMFLAEISAAMIHLKHIFTTSFIHHICMMVFVLTRLIFFPFHVIPNHYMKMMESQNNKFLIGGLILNIFVVVFSSATVFVKRKMFYRSFIWLWGGSDEKKKNNTKIS